MDGSQFAPHPAIRASVGTGVGTAENNPVPLPEREWGLTARQVLLAVLAIIAASEVIGALS